MMLDPDGFNELCQSRYGPMLFNKNDWPIGTSLRNYGEYAWEELKLLKQVIRPDNLVIDAGANIGTHTVFFSQLVPDGFVMAFEPQRIAFQTLCANLALNNCTNVLAVHAALGKECGTIIVPERDQYKINNFGGVPLAGITEGSYTELKTIDNYNLRICSVIKADVEGMEAELLMGAAKTIAKHRPILYLEADGAQSEEAIRMLFDLKYKCYWSLPCLFNPNNFAKNKQNWLVSLDGTVICSVNILCVPDERNVVIDGLRQIQSPDEKPVMRVFMEKEECLV